MARKRSPSQKALAAMPDAAGGALALRGDLLARAGYTVEKQAEVTKVVLDGALEDALHAVKVSRLVVADGRGSAHVETYADPDLALRQRNREFLADTFGLAPSKSQQAPPPTQVNVQLNFATREQQQAQAVAQTVKAKVIDHGPVRP